MADDQTADAHARLIALLKDALALADNMGFAEVGIYLDRALHALDEEGALPDDLRL